MTRLRAEEGQQAQREMSAVVGLPSAPSGRRYAVYGPTAAPPAYSSWLPPEDRFDQKMAAKSSLLWGITDGCVNRFTVAGEILP